MQKFIFGSSLWYQTQMEQSFYAPLTNIISSEREQNIKGKTQLMWFMQSLCSFNDINKYLSLKTWWMVKHSGKTCLQSCTQLLKLSNAMDRRNYGNISGEYSIKTANPVVKLGVCSGLSSNTRTNVFSEGLHRPHLLFFYPFLPRLTSHVT